MPFTGRIIIVLILKNSDMVSTIYDSCSQSKPSRAHDENNRYLSTSIQYDVSRVHLGIKEISVLEYSKKQLNSIFVMTMYRISMLNGRN